MTTLQEMHQITSYTPAYDRMVRSVQPMCNYFGVNQFYYSRIVSKNNLGYYSCIATHLHWNEFFFENVPVMQDSPNIRHPKNLKPECMLFKQFSDPSLDKILEMAWFKFKINFIFNFQRKIPDGIELFGFGIKHNTLKAERHLLNGLPLLSRFIDFFYEENKKLIHLANDHQVEISKLLGSCFYETSNPEPISEEKNLLLKQLGFEAALSLTMREKEVLRFLAHGYPASYISKQLHLSTRTVEHHIATIKEKLHCDSRAVLIKTAHEITSTIP